MPRSRKSVAARPPSAAPGSRPSRPRRAHRRRSARRSAGRTADRCRDRLRPSASRSGRPAGCRNSRRSPCTCDRPSGAPRRSRRGRNARRRSAAPPRRPRRSGPSWSDRSRRRRGLPASCPSTRFTVAAPGRCVLKALAAWFTSAMRSARNSTRFTQFARIRRSASAITVRVLPAPVAMTSSALRCWSRSKASATRRMARSW